MDGTHSVVCAYAELQAQTDRLFAELTDLDNPLGVRVSFTTCQAPYASAEELIHAVRTQRELEVISTPRGGDGCHPMFECEPGGPYDRFRAVHDIAGHARLGLGFDRDGEYATWLAQDAQYRGLARWALATELHGEHSVYWTTGEPAEHKGFLLPPELLARSKAGVRTQTHGVNPRGCQSAG